MVILSIVAVTKGKIKCRLYEDDEETCVLDFNNALNRNSRKRKKVEIHFIKKK